MATKIETSLTPEQLHEFFHRCSQLKGCLLRDIQALAEEFGVEISLMSATRFRAGAFAEYLNELNAKRKMAEAVAEIAKSGLSLSEAAASVLNQKIFDQALNLDISGEGALDESNTLSLALSRLRQGDHRAKVLEQQLKLYQAQLDLRIAQIEEYQRKETEWEEKRAAAKTAITEVKSKGGLSKETLAKIEEAAGLL